MDRNRFILKNLKNKKQYSKLEIRRLVLKFLFCFDSSNDKWYYLYCLSKMSRLASPVRLRNYCLSSGQARSVSRRFGLSRLMLKYFLSKGLIKSFKKSGW